MKQKKKQHDTLLGRWIISMQHLLIKGLQFFVPVDNKQIIFVSNECPYALDATLVAYELLRSDEHYAEFTFVQPFEEAQMKDQLANIKRLPTNWFGRMYVLLRSKYWITNTIIEEYVSIKQDKHIYIRLGNGVPVSEVDICDELKGCNIQKWNKKARMDYVFTYGEFDAELLTHIFPKVKRINQVGSLRKYGLEKKKQTFNRLRMMGEMKLNPNKPNLLYLPTKQSNDEQGLGKEALIELTTTYNVIYRGTNWDEDVSDLPGVKLGNEIDLADLFLVSDLLVTNYANELFDFAVMRKPIYLFETESDKMATEHYIDLVELGLPVAASEKELMSLLHDHHELDSSSVEDLLTYYNAMPSSKTVDFLFEIIPAAD